EFLGFVGKIGVHGGNAFGAKTEGLLEAAADGGAIAALVAAHDDVDIIEGEFLHGAGGAVGGIVVDHDDGDGGLVGTDFPNQRGGGEGFVIGGDGGGVHGEKEGAAAGAWSMADRLSACRERGAFVGCWWETDMMPQILQPKILYTAARLAAEPDGGRP